MTKKVTYVIVIILWSISLVMAIIVSAITYDNSGLHKKLAWFIYPIMSWSIFLRYYLYMFTYIRCGKFYLGILQVKKSSVQ